MPPRPTLQTHGCALLPTICTPTQLAPLIPLADDALSDPTARATLRRTHPAHIPKAAF